MKKTILLATILVSFWASFAQKNKSSVEDSSRKEIIDMLIANKGNSDFPYVYEKLNDKSRVIRIIRTAVVVKDKESVNYDLDYLKSMRILNQNLYLFYNVQDNGHYQLIGTYTANDSLLGKQLYPPEGFRATYLDEVARYYEIDSVEFYSIYGLNISVMDKGEIWFVNGDSRADLKTHVKESYPTLGEFRSLFLLYGEPYSFKPIQ